MVGELREMVVKVVLVIDAQEAQDRDPRKPSGRMVWPCCCVQVMQVHRVEETEELEAGHGYKGVVV